MLVEMAVADAVGIAFEFVPDTADRPNDLSRFYQHPTYSDMVPGCYTDDTQRSLANATVLLFGGDKDGRAYSPLAYLEAYQYVFERDPRPGYSKRFEAFLKDNLHTHPVDMALKLNRKATNGAVMGAAALGFLSSPEKVKLAAAAQALSTHSYASIPYAQIVALSAFYTINNVGKLTELNTWLYKELHESGTSVAEFLGQATFAPSLPSTITMGASSAVKTMLYALPRNNSLAALIKLAVEVGGDTDSAAAIMVAVASESLEYVDDIPQHLYDSLENGTYGRDYLTSTDAELRGLRA
jgi:ADP-ribosylglycohydrolase